MQWAATSAMWGPQPLAVLTLDLDRFKHVNDVLGYAFGDRLLQAVADKIGSGRTAGHGSHGRQRLPCYCKGRCRRPTRWRAASTARFEEPLVFEDQSVDLSAGIGIACWPDDADDADTLLSRSDCHVCGKRQLGGALRCDPGFDLASAQTLSLLSELRRAVEHNELRLYLQPKVALHGQPGLAAEALVRWQHPQRGLVPPVNFIPFAEQTGLVRQLTLWVFEEVARLLASPQARHLPLRVSVNLSTRDLLHSSSATGWRAFTATACRPAPLLRSPKAPSWMTSARRGHAQPPVGGGSNCPLMISAPGTRRWPTSNACRWTSSRSTNPLSWACRRVRTTP